MSRFPWLRWATLAVLLLSASPALAITLAIDYTFDTGNFFDTQGKRDLLQAAADTLTVRLQDDLAAIVPSGGNTWNASITHPATGVTQSISNPTIPANTIVVYAGARNLDGLNLGEGGPGGWGASGSAGWLSTVGTRGEGVTQGPAANEFGPWGGSITFTTNPGITWSYGGALPAPGQYDFFSVAVHELAHLLGFGTSDSWDRLVSGTTFTGAASTAANAGVNPTLSAGMGHWVNGTTSAGRETAMDPSIMSGLRKGMTPLDFAGLDDIGWSIAPPGPPGDLNLDGLVNLVDVNIVGIHWQTPGPAGDANGDAIVNLLDVQVVGANWNPNPPPATGVPEPTSATLAALASLGLLVRLGHRRVRARGRLVGRR